MTQTDLRAASADALTATMRALWDERGERIATRFEVAPCPYDDGELAAFGRDGRAAGFLPPEVATRATRHLLGSIFPQMQCYSVLPDNIVTNDESPSGWFDYETAIDVPSLDTDEAQLDGLAPDGRALLSLNQYIVASQDSRHFTGRYLDERRTWTRVASRVDGPLLAARFDGPEMAEGLGDEEPVDGSLLLAYDVTGADRGPMLGGVWTTTLGRHDRHLLPAAASGPSPEPPVTPTDPQVEWDRQMKARLERGFHAALGLSAEEYRVSMPRIGAQPASYRGRFDVPLLVETRLGWEDQAALAGIALSGGSRRVTYEPYDERSRPPEGPYVAWANAWGQRFPDPIAPADARQQLGDDEVGANLDDLVALHLARPEDNEHGRFVDVIGCILPGTPDVGLNSPMSTGRTPCLYRWRGRPEVGANLHPLAFLLFRPLVRGAAVTR